MKECGFTLVELMISMALLTVIGTLSFVAIEAATSASVLAMAQDRVQSSVRDAMNAITTEAETAAKQSNNSLVPPLQTIEIVNAPAPGCPVELVFQVPLDGTRLLWSSPIRFRYINEDTNGNAALDPGEDVDGDGALTRRIVRMQDINGDGDEDDPGEQRPLAAANDLSDVQFALDADHSLLTIRLEASALTSGRRMERVTAAVTSRVYVCN